MPTPLVTALACMTIGAPEPARLVRLITDMGWEVCGEGAITTQLEALWGIASVSAGSRFTLLRSPGSTRGMIRVVQGPDRYPTRQMGTRCPLQRHPRLRLLRPQRRAHGTLRTVRPMVKASPH